MTHDDSSDRDAILARRAALLSTALAAFSCSSPRDPATEPSVNATTTVTATSTAAATSTATARTNTPAPLRPWSEVMAAAPPRGAPPGASAQEKQSFEWLEQRLTNDYDTIKAMWEKPPACDAADPDCRPAWREAGTRAQTMFQTTRPPSIGGCGGASGETATLVGRRQAHNRYIAKLVEEIEAHYGAIAASFSAQGEQEWLKVLANAKKPPPMPCLSPCAMPEVSALLQAVAFAKDDAKLNATDPATKMALESVVASYKGNRGKSKIVVRGHASADEAKPAEIAAARAKAVATWLVGAGIPKDRVETKAYGVDAPLERQDGPAAGQNRRVDFEAVKE